MSSRPRELWVEKPLLGHGPGTEALVLDDPQVVSAGQLPPEIIFDNQYLQHVGHTRDPGTHRHPVVHWGAASKHRGRSAANDREGQRSAHGLRACQRRLRRRAWCSSTPSPSFRGCSCSSRSRPSGCEWRHSAERRRTFRERAYEPPCWAPRADAVRARRLIALGLGVAALASGGRGAGGRTASTTAAGPQPATVTVRWGETVVFSNRDSEPHVIEVPRETYHERGHSAGRDARVRLRRSSRRRTSSASSAAGPSGPCRGRGGRAVTLTAKESHPLRKAARRLGHVDRRGLARSRSFARVPDDPGAWEELATAEVGDDGAFVMRVELDGRRPLPGGGRSGAGPLGSDPGRRPASGHDRRIRSRPSRSAGCVEITGKIAPAGAAKSAVLEVYDPDRKRWQRVDGACRRIRVRHPPPPVRGRRAGRPCRITLQRSALASGFAPTSSRWIALRVS